MNNKILTTVLKKLIPAFFYVTLLIFLVLYLQQLDYSKLKNINIDIVLLTVASIFSLFTRYWGGFIWINILKNLGAKELTDRTQLIYIYAKSWLGRYIPGTAPWILGKIYFASKLGISKNKLAVSSLLEGALQVVVTLILAFVLLIFDERLDIVDGNIKLMLLVAITVCTASMIPAVFNKIISVTYKLIKRKQFLNEHKADLRTIAQGAGLYAINAIIGGLSLLFIAKAFYPQLNFDDTLFIIGGSTLAGALSMLAFFAPSGLGVREGIQLAFLSMLMPTEIAFVITVATRLWSVILDLLFFVLAKITYHIDRQP